MGHFKLKVRQFIEMVSGADNLDTETNMYGGRGADSSSEDMEEALDNEAHCVEHSANGNTSRNGNVEDSSTPEAETPSESMDVEPSQRGTSILSNHATGGVQLAGLRRPMELPRWRPAGACGQRTRL